MYNITMMTTAAIGVIVISILLITAWYSWRGGDVNVRRHMRRDTTTLIKWISSGIGMNGDFGEWSPGNEYANMVIEIGEPDTVDPRKGGVASWYMKRSWYARAEIRDQHVPGIDGNSHFVYLTIDYNLSTEVLDDMRVAVPGLTYDAVMQQFTVSGNSLRVCKVKAHLVMLVADGQEAPTDIADGKRLSLMLAMTDPKDISFDVNTEIEIMEAIMKRRTDFIKRASGTKQWGKRPSILQMTKHRGKI
jgi:hypothetical protein